MSKRAAEAYTALLESLTPENLEQLRQHLSAQARFKDPFNDVAGVDAVIRIYRKMFEDISGIVFRTTGLVCSGNLCYFTWTLHCRTRRGRRRLQFQGVTELQFDSEGRILAHIDHWDAASQLYERLPLLGSLIAKIRRRLSAA